MGFYNVAQQLLAATGVDAAEAKLRVLNVSALMRNSMHSNGIHYGYKGSSTVANIDGVEFRFDHGQRVQCGSRFHILTAIRASVNILDELLATPAIKAVAIIHDEYAVQRAGETK